MSSTIASANKGSDLEPRPFPGRLPAAVPLLLFLSLCPGCAWRTSKADHSLGPTFYRFGETSKNTLAVETMHVPILLEGGTQWGLSLGCVRRFTLSSITAPEPHGGMLTNRESRRWNFSLLYLRAPANGQAVFMRRSVVGLHGGAGAEERSLTVGYSSITATTPRENALHQLDYSSRVPLDSILVVIPASEISTSPPVTDNAP